MTTLVQSARPRPDNFEYNTRIPLSWRGVLREFGEYLIDAHKFLKPFGIATSFSLMYLAVFFVAIQIQFFSSLEEQTTLGMNLGLTVFAIIIMGISVGGWQGFLCVVLWLVGLKPALQLIVEGIYNPTQSVDVALKMLFLMTLLLTFWDTLLNTFDPDLRRESKARRALRTELNRVRSIMRTYIKEQDHRTRWQKFLSRTYYIRTFATPNEYVVGVYGIKHIPNIQFNLDELGKRYEVVVTRRDGISSAGNPMIDFHIPRQPQMEIDYMLFADKRIINRETL